jgi:hypothetical protein
VGPLCLRMTEFEFSTSVFENAFLTSMEKVLTIGITEM